MDFLHAALTVLQDAERPLTTREISDEALRRGLLTSQGKTSGATMSARLYVEARNNPDGPLVKVAAPGPTRALRGSVRWALRPTPTTR